MDTNLIPISQIVKLAKTDKIHLAYLTRLRLLPQTQRRKVNDHIEGCYPDWVIPLIKKVENLKDNGLTYSQIRFQLQNQSPASIPASLNLSPASGSYSIAFLLIGLILGYLLARTNSTFPPASSPLTNDTSRVLDANTKAILTTTSTPQQDTSPIYIIALPSQHLDKLGTININELFSGIH